MERNTKDPVILLAMLLIIILFAELGVLFFFGNTKKVEASVRQNIHSGYRYECIVSPNASPMAKEVLKKLFSY